MPGRFIGEFKTKSLSIEFFCTGKVIEIKLDAGQAQIRLGLPRRFLRGEAALDHMVAALALRSQTGNLQLQIESRNVSADQNSISCRLTPNRIKEMCSFHLQDRQSCFGVLRATEGDGACTVVGGTHASGKEY